MNLQREQELTFEQAIRRLASRGHAKIPEDVMFGIVRHHETRLSKATTDGRRETKLEGVENVIAILAEADDLPGVDTPEKQWAYTRALDRVRAVALAEYQKELEK